MYLIVHQLPNVNIGSDLEFCVDNDSVALTTNLLGGTWSGTGITDSIVGIFDPSIATVGANNIYYQYTDTNDCVNTDTLISTVYALPVVYAGGDTMLMCNQAIADTLTGFYPTPGTWSGLGITDSIIGEFIPPAVGLFDTYYEYTDIHGCTNSDTLVIEVIELTQADAGQDTAICVSVQQIQLSGSPVNGTWSNNNINSFGTYNIVNSGNFEFYYSIGTGTCLDKDTVNLIIHALPVITISNDFNICEDVQPIDLFELPLGGAWAGIGITDTINGIFDPSIVLIGNYGLEYQYTDPSTNCSDTVHIFVYVRPKPLSAFQIDSPICINSTVTPTNLSTSSIYYNWYINNIEVSNTFQPAILFNTLGLVNVMLIDSTIYGCDDTSSFVVNVIDKPDANFAFTPNIGCEPLVVGFNNNTTGNSWASFWDFGNGVQSIDSFPQNIIYELNGPLDTFYIISLTESNQCGATTITDSVHIYSIPEVNFNLLNSTGCAPYMLDLSQIYVDVPLGVHWNFNDGTTSNSLVSEHLFSNPGNYNIEITVDGPLNCLSNGDTTFSQTIVVYDNAFVSYQEENIFICKDDSIYLHLTGAISYEIQNNNINLYTNTGGIYLKPSSNSTYQIIGTDVNGCQDDTSIFIKVEDIKFVNLGNDTCLNYNESLRLDAGHHNENVEILWSTGDSIQTIIVSASYSPYYVDIIPEVCPIITDEIYVDYCPVADVPNAFSPNGDGNNDVLYIEGNDIESMHLRIYNRWGIIVFESKNKNKGWDGTYRGMKLEMEVYVYTLWVRFDNNMEITKNGNITLLR